MAGGVAHVLEVVVFAAGAHAALAGGGAHVVALVAAEEAVLELHHAGIGEQQRRVVARHEAGGRDHGVAAFAEKFEEGATDVRRAHERRFLGHGLGGLGLSRIGFAAWIGVRLVVRDPLQNSADMIR